MKELCVEFAPSAASFEGLDILVVPVFEEDFEGDTLLSRLDAQLGGVALAVAARESFRGHADTELSLTPAVAALPPRVALLGLGKAAGFGPARRLAAAVRAVRAANAHHAKTLGLAVRGGPDGLPSAALGVRLGAYAFDRYRTRDEDRSHVARVVLAMDDAPAAPAAVLATAERLASSVLLARDLVNDPGGSLSPRAFAEAARQEATAAGLGVEVLDRDALAAMGAGLLLGVGAGGREGPFVVRLTWRPAGAGDTPAVALVGKGITFDAGGLNLKPRGSIDDMKSDMAGAAAVLGAMRTLPTVGCPVAVDGWLAISDNVIGPDATRPGDVLKSLSGRTVEIGDTDAEGRLVLADVLTLAVRHGAARLVDLATLTGACVVALGDEAAGLFSTDDALAEAVLAAGRRTGEELWRLPLYEHVRGMLKSDIADLRNVGERGAGAIQGAMFLRDFAEDRPFLHLDIAGPAWLKKDHALGPKGGTGFGLRTLVDWLSSWAV